MSQLFRFVPLAVPFFVFVVLLAFSGGFDLWSLGETRNWMQWLQDGPGSIAARSFWAVDNRNPLSPWWYISMARPLLTVTSAAMFILQLTTGLFLSIAAFLMVTEATRGRARTFAAGLMVAVSLFTVNYYLDSIHWNFLGALGFSLLSVWGYAKFLNSGRTKTHWYVASLLFFFIAVATYSIQAGAFLAIAVLAFMSKQGLRDRIEIVAKDVTAYVVLFVLFLLIWKTTSLMGVASLPLNPTVAGFLKSMRQVFWHSDYTTFAIWASQAGTAGIAFALITAGIAFALVWRESRNNDWIRPADLALVFVLGAALIVPTIALESASDTWVPGSRMRMVMQFWTPLLFCSLMALATLAIPQHRVRSFVWSATVAGFVFYAVLCNVGMNLTQRVMTATERVFIAKLRATAEEDLAQGAAFPRHYIISRTVPNGPSDSYVYQGYARTEMPLLPGVTYRYFPADYGLPLKFEADGVTNPATHFTEKVPYARVAFLKWDGQGFSRLKGPEELSK